MSRTLLLACAVAGLTALAAGGASARTDAAAPGVTATSIRIGGTFPLTGEASGAASIARGADAYFKYVNASGGLFKRRIDFRYRDDGFDPAKTLAATQKLVSRDRVFAVFGSYGTQESLAVRPLLNSLRVPQLFVSSGATSLGRDTGQYPWTVGFPPSFAVEGRLLAHEVLRTASNPRIGVLYENDDYGTDLLKGFRRALGADASAIVAAEPYDPAAPDVRAQVQALKASKATTLVLFADGRTAIEAYVFAAQFAWQPKTYVSSAAATASVMKVATASAGKRLTDGSVSIAFVKDPSSPEILADAGYRLFKTILGSYDPGLRATDANAMYGMAAAYTMVDALRQAGPNPTRRGVLRAAANLHEHANPFVLPGVVVKTSATDHFPIAQDKLQRWQNGHWIAYGKLLSG